MAEHPKTTEMVGHVPAGERGKQFPPFDRETFASQLVWLAIAFITIYLIIGRFAIPRRRSDRRALHAPRGAAACPAAACDPVAPRPARPAGREGGSRRESSDGAESGNGGRPSAFRARRLSAQGAAGTGSDRAIDQTATP